MVKLGRRLLIKGCYIIVDVVCILLAIYLACFIRQTETLPFEANINSIFLDPVNPYRFIFQLWLLVAVLINHNHGLYETKREIFESLELWHVFRSVALTSLVVIVAIYSIRVEKFPRSIFLLVTVFNVISFSLWRFVKRHIVGYLVSQGYNNQNVLIIGAGKVGRNLSLEINKRPQLGINVVGFLDESFGEEGEKGSSRVIGKISDFYRIASSEFIDQVFITDHYGGEFLDILEQSKDLGVAVRVIPQGYELMSGEFGKYNIGLIPILEYREAKLYRKQAGKRIFDLMMSFLLAIILLPIFIILAFLVKIDSPGPVLYFSKRYGRNGRVFNMFKFRSMVVDADDRLHEFKDLNEVDGPIFKIKNDPRITKIGSFLRKYSLDELPQIFNVVIGDMSLVGPRPLPINQVEREDLRQIYRLKVRPGITGLWQIRGRSDTTFYRLVRWDIWYISNWSLWLDLKILMMTLPVVLKGRGAY